MSTSYLSYSSQRAEELNLKQFEIRKTAKICICCVCFIHIFFRLSSLLWDTTFPSKSIVTAEFSLLFCTMMITIISLEYFAFKIKGPSIVKYSNVVDLALLVIFVGDWISFLLSSLYEIQQNYEPPFVKASALYGFTSFSWRTLLITLLVQKWQFKVIALTTATFVVTGYAMNHSQEQLMFIMFRAIAQLFKITLIVYCQDKVKWRLMRTNLEQEKWMQLNDFILDSIPEKIMILDLNGEAKFMSEYCKLYLKKFNLSLNAREFFRRVRNLQQLQNYDFDPACSPTTPTTVASLSPPYSVLDDENPCGSESELLKVGTLQDLVSRFPKFISSKHLQERQFLAYNGKFKPKTRHTEKCMEMKLSFVQHYENDYIILIFRDTTQRDRLIALEEADKYKDRLLASISHELRAPLNGNINLVEGAINSSETPEIIKDNLLIPALRSSKFLLHIINDILDITQIKQKKLRLIFQIASLEDTLINIAQLVEFQARKKDLDLLVEIDDQISQKFCTDHIRVGQIVLNLLTNAVKFTNQGTIKLLASHMPGSSSVKISVEDTGIGITQENLKRIFTSGILIDIEDGEKMNPHGVGLGLNIASNLAQLLGPEGHKKIVVASVPQHGSIFTFILENKPLQQKKLPLLEKSFTSYETTEELTLVTQPKIFHRIQTLTRLCSSSSKIEEKAPLPIVQQGLCSCAKVLIVDDNPFNTVALEIILRSLGIKCDSVYNGASAIEKLKDRQASFCSEDCKQYSVVFMDQEMPGMSGNETTREIKKLQKENKLSLEMRIIGCTAHSVKEEVDGFLASGLENCIFKPVSVSIIKDILKELC